jgi:flagellar biosynthesis protein FliR
MYSLFGVMIFIAIDGVSWVVKGLGRTYDAIPLLQAPSIGSLTHGAEIAFSGVFLSAVMIAAPVLIAVTIVDAAFGVVSKVVPQMNIFAVGFPAKMLVGLTLIGATLPFVSGFVVDELQQSVAQALHFLKVA